MVAYLSLNIVCVCGWGMSRLIVIPAIPVLEVRFQICLDEMSEQLQFCSDIFKSYSDTFILG